MAEYHQSLERCPKLDNCHKIGMILDKDLLDFQYAEAIRNVCAKCEEGGGSILKAKVNIGATTPQVEGR